jgi:hypothetical protein
MDINYLKSRFENGDIPTGKDFSDLIDSCYNFSGSTEQMSINDLVDVNITNERSNQLLILSGNTWVNIDNGLQLERTIDVTNVTNQPVILRLYNPIFFSYLTITSDSDKSTVSFLVNNTTPITGLDNITVDTNVNSYTIYQPIPKDSSIYIDVTPGATTNFIYFTLFYAIMPIV